MGVRDHIKIRERDMAETIWQIKGSDPTELTLTFRVFAGGNIGARWTNLFLTSMIGDEADAIVAGIKEKVEL
jgi:hypothetical protein